MTKNECIRFLVLYGEGNQVFSCEEKRDIIELLTGKSHLMIDRDDIIEAFRYDTEFNDMDLYHQFSEDDKKELVFRALPDNDTLEQKVNELFDIWEEFGEEGLEDTTIQRKVNG